MIKIPGFSLYSNKKNEIHFGSLYLKRITIDCAIQDEQNRVISIWVPDDFDIKKKYGVIYMSDGQNAVDKYLSAYGEWNMEDHLTNLAKQGYPEFIIVGIDCPKNPTQRIKEYTPYKPSRWWRRVHSVYGDKFGEYIINKIMSYVNNTFNVDKNLVGFVGSSMGGLFSFYMYAKYPQLIKFSLSFSPAFDPYLFNDIRKSFKMWNPNKDDYGRIAFYMGDGDPLERRLSKGAELVYSLLKKHDFESQMTYFYGEGRIHHEEAWSDYVEPALKFVLNSNL